MTNKIILSKNQVCDFNIITSFLALRDIEELNQQQLNHCFGFKQADLLILLGNSMPYIAEQAANAYKNGIVKELMIVGGKGHSTKYLRDNIKKHHKYGDIEVKDRAEADILREIVVDYLGVNQEHVFIENKSTNCGSNAREALKVIKNYKKRPKSIILMQDPIMQLRTHASFQHEWKEENGIMFINYATFIPHIKVLHESFSFVTDKIYGLWSTERFLSLVMGEIPRLCDDKKGYGPNGKCFIEHVDIPQKVMTAYEKLFPLYNEFLKIRNEEL
ncbi:YdcF family protein [Clostridium ganghwense]|uniref:YdcF family protein n=1 Tax=Clostridium ganghwense TaxID=312089 RepID=A0ABT4CSX7_9CLOT|nr:YdcF family protein [Clostridium ganghwense]MCY6371146.1 YdcF family protein [Clostridium ganghwense]